MLLPRRGLVFVGVPVVTGGGQTLGRDVGRGVGTGDMCGHWCGRVGALRFPVIVVVVRFPVMVTLIVSNTLFWGTFPVAVAAWLGLYRVTRAERSPTRCKLAEERPADPSAVADPHRARHEIVVEWSCRWLWKRGKVEPVVEIRDESEGPRGCGVSELVLRGWDGGWGSVVGAGREQNEGRGVTYHTHMCGNASFH